MELTVIANDIDRASILARPCDLAIPPFHSIVSFPPDDSMITQRRRL
jgi:hypothetical protein